MVRVTITHWICFHTVSNITLFYFMSIIHTNFFIFALRNWFLIEEYTSTFPGYNFSFIFHLQLHVKSNCSRAKNSQIHAALTNSNSIFNYMPGIRRCIYYCKRKIIVISNFGYDNVIYFSLRIGNYTFVTLNLRPS